MTDCLFCKIIAHSIPAEIVYTDENICAFKDLHPQAPVHILVVPRVHIKSLRDANPEQIAILSTIFQSLPKIAAHLNLSTGFKTVLNTGPGGGQEIDHFHFHILGNTDL